MSASTFLDMLYGNKEDGYIQIWELSDTKKESHWFKTPEDAAAFVENEKRELNVYVGVALAPKDFGKAERCPGNETIAIPGFWLDLDIADPVAHQKTNLPPNMAEARKFLGSFPLDPSVVIHSGHGLQAWWLFEEPWYFEDENDRDAAAYMAKRFVYTFKEMAKRKHWEIDSVHDLARVMRVPGTVNHKDIPVDVKILYQEGHRYTVDDIEQYLLEDVPKPRMEKGFLGELIMDEDASPPTEKLLALMENSPTFEATLKHKRKDMDGQSPSEYDMSLANTAVSAGWTAQEIVDLLIYHRRSNKLDKKMRLNYFELTIGKARENITNTGAKDKLQEFVLLDNMIDDEDDLDLTPERRLEMLTELSKLFGIKITNIERHMADPPSYYLITSRGDIMLGMVDNLIKQDKIRLKLAAATRKLLDSFSSKEWRNIAQCLLLACEDVGVGDEATVAGATRGYLLKFVSEMEESEDMSVALEAQIVWRDPETRMKFITASALKTFLRYSENERLSSREIGQNLRRAGCVPEKINVTLNKGTPREKRTTTQFWKLPRGM